MMVPPAQNANASCSAERRAARRSSKKQSIPSRCCRGVCPAMSQKTRQRPLTKNIVSMLACHEPSPRFLGVSESEVWQRCLGGHRLPLVDFRASYVFNSGGLSKKGAMSELRQRLLPIAKPPLALMGALRDFSRERDRAREVLGGLPRGSPRGSALADLYRKSPPHRRGLEGRSQFRRLERAGGRRSRQDLRRRQGAHDAACEGQGARQARARAGPARAQEIVVAAAPMCAARSSPASSSSA